MQWVTDAWNGWQNYKSGGKLAVLLLLALVYLALREKKENDGVRRVTVYSAVMALLCVFPLTAAAFMIYQTRFYNYEWIWSLIPVTAVTAMGGVLFLADLWKLGDEEERADKAGKILNNIRYKITPAAFLLAMILLCGRLGLETWESKVTPQKRTAAERVLTMVREDAAGEEICLWAPREILEFARVADSGIILLYGRNMWDHALNAYSYDVYPPEMENVYLWMEGAARNGRWVQKLEKPDKENGGIVIETTDGVKEMTYAMQTGANRILLKDVFTEEAMACVTEFAEANDLEIQRAEGYLLLKKRG